MGARDSTLAHMHQMLATATAVATASSCTQSDLQQTVTITPLPMQPTSADPTPPRPPPTASATFSAPVPVPPPPPDPSGYLVVDMLPAPARCMGLAAATYVIARFHRDANGIVIAVGIQLPTGPTLATYSGTAPTAMSGTIATFAYRNNSTYATAKIRPVPQTAQNIGASFPVTCAGGSGGTLFAHVSFSGTPADGAPVNVTLTDY